MLSQYIFYHNHPLRAIPAAQTLRYIHRIDLSPVPSEMSCIGRQQKTHLQFNISPAEALTDEQHALADGEAEPDQAQDLGDEAERREGRVAQVEPAPTQRHPH